MQIRKSRITTHNIFAPNDEGLLQPRNQFPSVSKQIIQISPILCKHKKHNKKSAHYPRALNYSNHTKTEPDGGVPFGCAVAIVLNRTSSPAATVFSDVPTGRRAKEAVSLIKLFAFVWSTLINLTAHPSFVEFPSLHPLD